MTEYWTLFYSWIVSNPAAATGIFISIVALAATIFLAHAARVQNKQSVRPFLNALFELASENGHDFVELWLSNVGLGPALIDDFAIHHAGKAYRGDAALNLFTEVLEDCTVFVLKPNGAIAAGEKHMLLRIKVHKDGLAMDEIQDFLNSEYELIVNYRSFMNQKARYSSKNHEFLLPL
mgnify:CR=1 FL=1|tara:strand:- start:102 stop:635 length:534 start_codon:yes stop_codon:yes gene_type:complete